MANLIGLDEYRFDADTGEIFKSDDNGKPSERIPPQPAQLLNLLIEHYPAVVSRETIQQAIWPGVKTDFDGNLHFCIRQIRAAFGDSASNPKFVETIPRRGYRLIVSPVVRPKSKDNGVEKSERDEDEATTEVSNSTFASRESSESSHSDFNGPAAAQSNTESQHSDVGSKSIYWIAPTIFLVALLAVILFVFAINRPNSDESNEISANIRPTRVAIMPFEADRSAFKSLGSGSIALKLLEMFEDDFGKTIDVVGPTTTSQYSEPGQLKKLIEQTKPELIVNGRYVESADANYMLAEIIRAEDGAHVWVKRYLPSSDVTIITQQIRDALNDLVRPGQSSK